MSWRFPLLLNPSSFAFSSLPSSSSLLPRCVQSPCDVDYGANPFTPQELLEKHYGDLSDKPFFPKLVQYSE